MKKLTTILLVLLAVSTLTACTEKKEGSSSDSTYTSELIKASVLDYDKVDNIKTATQEDYEGLQSFEITPQDAYNFIAVDPSVKLVDVREPQEYIDSHIEGSILIPLRQLSEESLRENGIVETDYVILYCRSGNRSAQAHQTVSRLGAYSSNSMAGGINQWVNEGLPVITN